MERGTWPTWHEDKWENHDYGVWSSIESCHNNYCPEWDVIIEEMASHITESSRSGMVIQ